MQQKMEYVTLYSEETFGDQGGFALEIRVAATKLPDLDKQQIKSAAYEAARKVSAEVLAAIKASNPSTLQAIARNRELVSLFPKPIFVEEVENGYCKDWCCRHLPWFVITTTIGRFKIGWRKRVIAIDWSETVGTATSEDLFSGEDTTKSGKSIHAWSLEAARRYIGTVIKNSVGQNARQRIDIGQGSHP